jgi:hypothetical protein
VSTLWLYAVTGAPAPLDEGDRLDGSPVRVVPLGGLCLVATEREAPPAVTAEALREHDRIVRCLADLTPALLPARFGQTAPDVATLQAAIAPRAGELARALERVAGCRQMTLRLFAEDGAPVAPAVSPAPDEEGPGARYLRERRQLPDAAVETLRALGAALGPLVRAERIEPAASPRLVATAYHLVPTVAVADYTDVVGAHAPRGGIAVRVSGPWPPYAFAELP